ncbi:MAG: hypothetical protein MUC51_02645 [Anaerolineae bacterium]|jgi:hypothetical protein|nr:hypothetical protein [Anaerolineae bacterium]
MGVSVGAWVGVAVGEIAVAVGNDVAVGGIAVAVGSAVAAGNAVAVGNGEAVGGITVAVTGKVVAVTRATWADLVGVGLERHEASTRANKIRTSTKTRDRA